MTPVDPRKNDYVINGWYLKHILHRKYIWKLHWYFRKGRSCKYFQFFHIHLCLRTFVYWTLLGAYSQFDTHMKRIPRKICINGILLPKLFWCTVRKNCSSDWEKLLKFEVEGQEFATFLRSLEHFIQTVKNQNNFW